MHRLHHLLPGGQSEPALPGPKQAGPDGERLRLKDPALYDEALKYCTNCKRCEVACPSDVKIGDIIQRARADFAQSKPTLRDAILSHTDIMGSLSTPFAPIVNAATGLKPVRKLLDKALKIDHRRELPKYSFGTFRRWYRQQAQAQQRYAEQVAFFHGCFVNYNHPQLGKDLVRVFNALDIGVQLLKREKCCGVPLIANGFIDQAKKQARVNAESLQETVLERGIPVVATSSSCTFTLRDEYPHLLDVDTTAVRDRVELATRYLYRLINQGRSLPLKRTPLRVAYHTPCHMEKMGWTAYTLELLRQIPGLELVVLDSQCCGIAGTYGFKSENYATSQGIGAPLFRQIEESGVDLVVTDCETCKWQIEMSTSKRCEHPITCWRRRWHKDSGAGKPAPAGLRFQLQGGDDAFGFSLRLLLIVRRQRHLNGQHVVVQRTDQDRRIGFLAAAGDDAVQLTQRHAVDVERLVGDHLQVGVTRALGVLQALGQGLQAVGGLVAQDDDHCALTGAVCVNMHVVGLVAQLAALIRHADRQGERQFTVQQAHLLPGRRAGRRAVWRCLGVFWCCRRRPRGQAPAG